MTYREPYLFCVIRSGSGYARVEFPPGYSFSRSGYRFVRHEEWETVLRIMDGARRIGSLVYQCSGGNLRDGDDFAVEAHFYRNGYTGSESMEQYFLNLGFIVPKTRTILTADGYRMSGKTRKSVCI